MPSVIEPLQLLVAGASLHDPSSPEATPPPPPLAALEALLRHLRPGATIEVAQDSPEMPYEHALARAQGLPGAPGQIPWAAFDNGLVGTACAWIHPCYWQLGMDSVALLDPAHLHLAEDESRALLQPIAELMREDGIAISWIRPTAWLARSALFRGLTTWSVHRAAGQTLTRDVLARTTDEAQRRQLRRHQLEWQMLLHDVPVNDAREGAGRPFVNALWIDGAGVLDAPVPPRDNVITDTGLRSAGSDGALRAAAWQAVDRKARILLDALRAGRPVRLVLCGPQRAQVLDSAGGLRARLSGLLRRPRPLAEYLAAL